MASLMDAARLVPLKKEQDFQEYKNLDEVMERIVFPPNEQSTGVTSKFSSVVPWMLHEVRQREEDERIFATKGALEFMNIEGELGKNEPSLFDRFVHWAEDKVEHWIEKHIKKFIYKKVREYLFKSVRWITEKIIKKSIQIMIEWVVEPVLEVILGFIGINPELWPFVAVAGGLVALGVFLYEKFTGSSAQLSKTKGTLPHEVTAHAETFPEKVGKIFTQEKLSVTRFADLVSKGEGGYNSVHIDGPGRGSSAVLDLQHMTVSEIMSHQANEDFDAAGRYQIIRQTMKDVVKGMGLSGKEMFDKQMQDNMFQYLVSSKRPKIWAYITGKTDDLSGAVLAASMEWASLAAPPGIHIHRKIKQKNGEQVIDYVTDGTKGYYESSTNHATISANEVASMLKLERDRYTGKTVPVETKLAQTPAITVPVKTTQHVAGSSNTVSNNSTSINAVQNSSQKTIIKGPSNTYIALAID